MALRDRTDFKEWLARFEAGHERLHGADPAPPEGRCDGCGEPLPTPVSSTGLCMICLAEHYGRDQGRVATRIAATLIAGVAHDEATSVEAVRSAIDDILDEIDRS